MKLQSETILKGYSEKEKGAYLAALASLANADRQASHEEVDHLRELSQSAGLSAEQEEFIVHSAIDLSGEDLKKCLDILKGSDLRYSLITDLMALAKADESVSDEERDTIAHIAQYLGVNNEQVAVLDQFVNKAAEKQATGEQASEPGFIDSLGLKEKFSNAGLGTGNMGRGLLGIIGPLVLGSIASRAIGGSRMRGGLMGGMLGGILGGNMMGGMGGLGSLIGGITRNRNNRSIGGLLGKLF